jgi:hypothetical protein
VYIYAIFLKINKKEKYTSNKKTDAY